MKKRNEYAKVLELKRYRKRIVKVRKGYTRKIKHKEKIYDKG